MYTHGMSKRLQVIFDDKELAEIQREARRRRMTVAEWVRQSLRAARRTGATGDVQRKLEALRTASKHSFPTGDIDEMLAQIERGYGE